MQRILGLLQSPSWVNLMNAKGKEECGHNGVMGARLGVWCGQQTQYKMSVLVSVRVVKTMKVNAADCSNVKLAQHVMKCEPDCVQSALQAPVWVEISVQLAHLQRHLDSAELQLCGHRVRLPCIHFRQ